jgi:hypothetical protein
MEIGKTIQHILRGTAFDIVCICFATKRMVIVSALLEVDLPVLNS